MYTKIFTNQGLPMYVNSNEIVDNRARSFFEKALMYHTQFLQRGSFCIDMVQAYELALCAGVKEAAINLAGALLLQARYSVNYEDKIHIVERLEDLLETVFEEGDVSKPMSDYSEVQKDALYVIEIMSLWGLADTSDLESLACQEHEGFVLADKLREQGYQSLSPVEIINNRTQIPVVTDLVTFDSMNSSQ
ncbi:MAG: hypothetical protein V8R67_03275 [Eubacterium sp.]